jgi:hypothetical protein
MLLSKTRERTCLWACDSKSAAFTLAVGETLFLNWIFENDQMPIWNILLFSYYVYLYYYFTSENVYVSVF